MKLGTRPDWRSGLAVNPLHVLPLLLCCVWPQPASATQSQQELAWIVDTVVRLCVIGGDRFVLRTNTSGGQEFELNSVNANGQLQGQFNVERVRIEGLVNGIDNTLSQVAAQQASEARNCLRPLRERLLVMLLPTGPADPRPAGNPPVLPQPNAQRLPGSGPGSGAVPRPPQPGPVAELGVGSGTAAPVAIDGDDRLPSPLAYRPGHVNQNSRGFDCSKAAMPMDFVICAFQEVYDVNTQHAVAWWATVERLSRPQRDELVQKQREWISMMLQRCGLPGRGRPTQEQARTAAPCVRDAYTERLRFVRNYRT